MYDIKISSEKDKNVLERIFNYYGKLKSSRYLYEGIITVINLYNYLKLNKLFILNNSIFTKKILDFYNELTNDVEYTNISSLIKERLYKSYINLCRLNQSEKY